MSIARPASKCLENRGFRPPGMPQNPGVYATVSGTKPGSARRLLGSSKSARLARPRPHARPSEREPQAACRADGAGRSRQATERHIPSTQPQCRPTGAPRSPSRGRPDGFASGASGSPMSAGGRFGEPAAATSAKRARDGIDDRAIRHDAAGARSRPRVPPPAPAAWGGRSRPTRGRTAAEGMVAAPGWRPTVRPSSAAMCRSSAKPPWRAVEASWRPRSCISEPTSRASHSRTNVR
jgi:hypothetical protein